MLSIGDFARFAGVSVRMLRHYDAVGLLDADLSPSDLRALLDSRRAELRDQIAADSARLDEVVRRTVPRRLPLHAAGPSRRLGDRAAAARPLTRGRKISGRGEHRGPRGARSWSAWPASTRPVLRLYGRRGGLTTRDDPCGKLAPTGDGGVPIACVASSWG